ncbi:hypothetical protein HK097_009839 [Rhizophlyctis rosea]|uniref:Thioredoxin domain-containing protein n=1 Tax=Rhizophlyctis rosea TaxID=64517 RepID=A0AAD5SHN9_9FUNG|nr:hypothetical protein HK097_009839 [Rhizophlyctis rosea]
MSPSRSISLSFKQSYATLLLSLASIIALISAPTYAETYTPSAKATTGAPTQTLLADHPEIEKLRNLEDTWTVHLSDAAEDIARLRDGNWLVQIYSPYCRHSRRLSPTWTQATYLIHNSLTKHYSSSTANDTSSESSSETTPKPNVILPLNFAKIDATVAPNLASLLEVKGYPSVKLITNQTIYTLHSSATLNNLIHFTINGGYLNNTWYNRMPSSFSIWYKLQLQLFNYLHQRKYHLDQWIAKVGGGTVNTVWVQVHDTRTGAAGGKAGDSIPEGNEKVKKKSDPKENRESGESVKEEL